MNPAFADLEMWSPTSSSSIRASLSLGLTILQSQVEVILNGRVACHSQYNLQYSLYNP